MKKKFASLLFALEIPLGVCAGEALDKGEILRGIGLILIQMAVTFFACTLWPTPNDAA